MTHRGGLSLSIIIWRIGGGWGKFPFALGPKNSLGGPDTRFIPTCSIVNCWLVTCHLMVKCNGAGIQNCVKFSRTNILIDFWCFNTTFNNISAIMATSFSGGGSRSTRREPPTMGKQLVNFIYLWLRVECTLFCNLQSRARTHAVLVIGTDYIGSCKSNYHTITTTEYFRPYWWWKQHLIYNVFLHHIIT